MPRPATRWIGAVALTLAWLPGCGAEPDAVRSVGAAPSTTSAPTTSSTTSTTTPPATTVAARVCCAYTVERAARQRVPTTRAPAPPPPPASPAAPPAGAGASTVTSTAYCLTGTMASGRRTYRGAVAANAWPLGTRLWVSASPYGPGVFTVEDRIGHGSQLDFAMPGDCAGARQWGRRAVQVRRA